MSRKVFEAKFGAQPYCLSMQKDNDGDYVSYGTKMAWEGWYAASMYAYFLIEDNKDSLQSQLTPD